MIYAEPQAEAADISTESSFFTNFSLLEDGTEKALDRKSSALFHVVLWMEVKPLVDLKDKHITEQQSHYSGHK